MKIFIRSGKMHHVDQVSKRSFYTFEDIDLRAFHAKLHKKPSETLGAD